MLLVLKASNYFDSKGFINTLSAVASGDGNTPTTSSCDGVLGSEFVIIDDFKTSAGALRVLIKPLLSK
jgi:hypothetical protein